MMYGGGGGATTSSSCYLAFLHSSWECRRTPLGREYYINHYTRTTQWDRPTRSVAIDCFVPLEDAFSLTLPAHRPGYESVQSSHRSRDPPLSSPLPVTTSLTRTQSPGNGGLRGGEGGSGGGVRSAASLPRESSTQGSPTQEQLTSSSSAPSTAPSQVNGGGSGNGTPTIVVSRNALQRRRPSTRQQLYMSRNTLHHELQLPDGYG